jgi:hypothetical protein
MTLFAMAVIATSAKMQICTFDQHLSTSVAKECSLLRFLFDERMSTGATITGRALPIRAWLYGGNTRKYFPLLQCHQLLLLRLPPVALTLWQLVLLLLRQEFIDIFFHIFIVVTHVANGPVTGRNAANAPHMHRSACLQRALAAKALGNRHHAYN